MELIAILIILLILGSWVYQQFYINPMITKDKEFNYEEDGIESYYFTTIKETSIYLFYKHEYELRKLEYIKKAFAQGENIFIQEDGDLNIFSVTSFKANYELNDLDRNDPEYSKIKEKMLPYNRFAKASLIFYKKEEREDMNSIKKFHITGGTNILGDINGGFNVIGNNNVEISNYIQNNLYEINQNIDDLLKDDLTDEFREILENFRLDCESDSVNLENTQTLHLCLEKYIKRTTSYMKFAIYLYKFCNKILPLLLDSI